jgi:hypothetical protein
MFTQVKFRVNMPAGNIFAIPYKNLKFKQKKPRKYG